MSKLNSLKKTEATLGILGLGSRSTIFYIEQLNHTYNQQLGGYSTCPLLLLNTDFNRINPYLPNQFSILKPILSDYLSHFAQIGIKDLIIPNITLHECYEQLDQKITQAIRLIHPISKTIIALKKASHKEIILIGSRYSMQSMTLHKAFIDAGIQVVIPEEKVMIMLDDIRQRIYASCESSKEIDNFSIQLTKHRKKAPLVIACTELSIANHLAKNHYHDKPTALYDMAEIQIHSAIEYLLSQHQ
jgi:aspartate racemase